MKRLSNKNTIQDQISRNIFYCAYCCCISTGFKQLNHHFKSETHLKQVMNYVKYRSDNLNSSELVTITANKFSG